MVFCVERAVPLSPRPARPNTVLLERARTRLRVQAYVRHAIVPRCASCPWLYPCPYPCPHPCHAARDASMAIACGAHRDATRPPYVALYTLCLRPLNGALIRRDES